MSKSHAGNEKGAVLDFNKSTIFSLQSMQNIAKLIQYKELYFYELNKTTAKYYLQEADTRILMLYGYLYNTNSLSFEQMLGLFEACEMSNPNNLKENKTYIKAINQLCAFLFMNTITAEKNYLYFCQFFSRFSRKTFISNLLNTVPAKNYQSLFEILFTLSIQDMNHNIFKLLQENNAALFASLKSTMNDITQFRMEFVQSLPPDTAQELTALIQQFTYGPGNLDSAGALLICLYKKSKNTIKDYAPVILSEDEIEILCNTLYKELCIHNQKVRQNFVIMSDHSTAGTIEMTIDRKVSILLLDSVGRITKESYKAEDQSTFSDDSNVDFNEDIILLTTKVFAENFFAALAKLNITDINLYIPEFRRQYSSKGCSIISMIDLSKLFNFFKNTGPNFFSSEACQVISKMTLTTDTGTLININFIAIPLIFITSSQKLIALTTIQSYSQADQEKIINSKGETPYQATAKRFLNGRNHTNDKKLKKWALVLQNYLFQFITKEHRLPWKEMEAFKIEAYAERISNLELSSSSAAGLRCRMLPPPLPTSEAYVAATKRIDTPMDDDALKPKSS